jgi:hypothetical protein
MCGCLVKQKDNFTFCLSYSHSTVISDLGFSRWFTVDINQTLAHLHCISDVSEANTTFIFSVECVGRVKCVYVYVKKGKTKAIPVTERGGP